LPKRRLTYQQTIAVGDGANDLPMLNLAGLELLFMPSNGENASSSISSLGLDGVCTF
jgi:phosphoserine phosphatase